MRFDRNVFFQYETPGTYDDQTGDYADASLTEVEKAANVSETGIDIVKIIYGTIRSGVKTVRILGDVEPFDHIRIGQDIYDVSRILHTQRITAYVCNQVQKSYTPPSGGDNVR